MMQTAPTARVDDVISRVWDAATSTQPAPEQGVILATGLAALALVVLPSAWRQARHLVTMAHEGAHGLVALLTGRRLQGITLHTDTSGRAVSSGRRRGLGVIATTAAGYLGPALLGLGGALLLSGGRPAAVLWIAVLLLAVLLVHIRNLWGAISVLAAGSSTFAVAWWADAAVQSPVAYGLVWFLLLAAPRPVLELQRTRRRGGGANSDADVLAKLTPLPAVAWVGVLLILTTGALVAGTQLLLG